jgi:hypothetical protein
MLKIYNHCSIIVSWARKTTRIRTKPMTQQQKQITRNVSLSLIQD